MSKKNILILLSLIFAGVLACGVIFQLVGSDEVNCPHLFQETKYDQMASLTEHNVKRICRTCGEILSEEKGEHIYKTVTTAPTALQLKACPGALEVISDKCIVCDHVKSATAILADLTFDGELQIPIGEYEGSANYQTLIASDPIESYKRTIAYFDQDPAFTCWSSPSISTQANLADGKLVMTAKPFHVRDDLNLSSANSVYDNATIIFDLTVNKDPATYTNDTTCSIFSTHDENLYNNCPIVLALGLEDLNSEDDVSTYGLYIYSKQNGKVIVEANTGVAIELGKEYTYKIEIDRDAAQFTLSYKLATAETYQRVGTYTYVPSKNISVVRFANSSGGTGNTFDNYRVTVKLK